MATLAVQVVYYVLPVVAVVTALVLVTGVYARHRTAAGATWFITMLLSGGALNLFHLLIAVSENRTVQWLAIFPRLLALVSVIAAFVLFCSAYTGRDFHRKRRVAAAMVAVFGSYAVLVATSPIHELLFVDYTNRSEPFGYVVAEPSVGSVVLLLGLVSFVAYATYVMVEHLLSTKRRAGWQIVLILLGALSVAAFEVAGNLGFLPATGMSHSGYGILPLFLCFFLALFRFDLLDVTPVARTRVVENLRDPVVILDADLRVVDFNDASTRIWPDVGDHLPEPFETACPELAREIDVPPGADAVAEKISLTTDGRDRYYSVTVSEVSRKRGDRTELYSIFLRDVTELEQSRQQLQTQNERLDQVASTISHDLRNPINVSQGHTTLLGDILDGADLDPAAETQASESLEKIRQGHDRMLDIIEDVLTLAREGKTVEETEMLDLSTVACEAWGTVATADATLTVVSGDEFPADRSKLLQVFENLFRNAVDHGHPGVSVEVGTTDDGFYVQDDGPGIDDAYRDSVFEYGYTTDSDNTGLGLSIVRTMAESHGWTVELDDSFDEGTRFVFHTSLEPSLSSDGAVTPPPPRT